MRITAVLCLIFSATQVFAQKENDHAQQTKTSIKYHALVEAGLLEGEAKSAFHAQVINGIQYETWYGGIGAGIDNYKFRTIPLFVDVRKNIFRKPTTPFLFADVGMQFPWVKDDEKIPYGKSDFKIGFYSNLGVGYKINLVKNNALLFSAGYSLKTITNNYTPICDFAACSEDQDYIRQMKYTMRRLILSVGWFF